MDEVIARAGPWAATLIAHNAPLFGYGLLTIWAALRAYGEPDRRTLLFLYGAAILIFDFEYRKHVVEIVDGTLRYLMETTPDAREVSRWLFVTGLPLATRLFGFGLVVASFASSWRQAARPDPARLGG